jgi:hypothetical protein
LQAAFVGLNDGAHSSHGGSVFGGDRMENGPGIGRNAVSLILGLHLVPPAQSALWGMRLSFTRCKVNLRDSYFDLLFVQIR